LQIDKNGVEGGVQQGERLGIVLCRLSAHKANVARTACLIYPNRKRHRSWGRGKIGSPSPSSSSSSSWSWGSWAPVAPGGQKRAKPEKNQKQRPSQKERHEQVEQYALGFFWCLSAPSPLSLPLKAN